MTTLVATDPRELMEQQRATLRRYAKRTIVREDSLSAHERYDVAQRIEEFMAIGSSFKLTKKEMVILLLREVFPKGRKCGCPGCRAKNLVAE